MYNNTYVNTSQVNKSYLRCRGDYSNLDLSSSNMPSMLDILYALLTRYRYHERP